jgi:hypothetical protein
MPNNNINISFDILKVQGAKKITGKDGKEYVAICIPESRLKRFQRKDGSESLFFELDVKANRDGEDKFGKTHFVAEAASKEERMAKTRLPIIGNGKEFDFGGSSGGSRASQHGAVKAANHPLMKDDGLEEDQIPW